MALCLTMFPYIIISTVLGAEKPKIASIFGRFLTGPRALCLVLLSTLMKQQRDIHLSIHPRFCASISASGPERLRNLCIFSVAPNSRICGVAVSVVLICNRRYDKLQSDGAQSSKNNHDLVKLSLAQGRFERVQLHTLYALNIRTS